MFSPPKGDDEPGERLRPFRRNRQLDVVGDEGIGMKRAAFFLKRFAPPVKTGLIVFLAKNRGLTVTPSLHDVHGTHQDEYGDRGACEHA